MNTFAFRRGQAFFSSDSPARLWRITFEDEGPAGYLYACDRTQDVADESILDSMLVYNNANSDEDGREYMGTVQWSRDGLKAVFYIDGSAQAYVDFAARQSFCRSNFPNFMDQSSGWRTDSHAWDEAALARFEDSLYA